MSALWRVACVRIPRFPVGAVWRANQGPRQLGLGLTDTPSAPTSATDRAKPTASPSTTSVTDPTTKSTAADQPHWDDRLLALADGNTLRAVTAAAGRARVRAGMTVTEARARCTRLDILPWDDIAIAGALTRATAALIQASPHVSPAGAVNGVWWVGATGFDVIGGERTLARTLLTIAQRWHPQARVAIADSCVAARAATWQPRTDSTPHAAAFCVPSGGDAPFLAPLPLTFLPLDDELVATLDALGIRTVGAFAALPIADIERRWGESGLRAWRFAHGDDPRRPVLARADADRSVTAELGGSSDTMEPALFLVRAALETLVRDLVRDGLAAAAVSITLHLDGAPRPSATVISDTPDTADQQRASRVGARPELTAPHDTITREVRPAHPLARVAPLFERCRALLSDWQIVAPICGVTVTLTNTVPATGEQGDLLDAGWRDPGAALAALERLRSTLGPNTVMRPVLRDDHRAEHAGAWAELVDGDDAAMAAASIVAQNAVPSRSDDVAPITHSGASLPLFAGDRTATPAALRLLETPQPVRMTCDAESRPMAGVWQSHTFTVHECIGPERLTGAWWRSAFARDYWHVRTREVGTLLLYNEQETWVLQGWYD
jgi:protein ImuB